MSSEEFQDPEENESADSKSKVIPNLFDSERSRESYNLYCTTPLSGPGHWF